MFQITAFQEAKLSTLTSRIEKHGDDEVPAVSLGLEMTAPNTLLDTIDPKLRQTLYAPKPDETPELPGVEASTPVLRCNSIDRVTLPTKHEGWTLAVDDGIDDTQPSTFGGCKVDKFSVEPLQGGSVVLRFRVGTSDLDAARSGMLGMHIWQAVWITLKAPEKHPDAIDGTGAEFAADHPEAGDLFAAQYGGPDDTDGEGSDPDIEDDEDDQADIESAGKRPLASGQASKAALDASGHNPFGTGAADSSAVEKPEARPRRGRAAAADVE